MLDPQRLSILHAGKKKVVLAPRPQTIRTSAIIAITWTAPLLPPPSARGLALSAAMAVAMQFPLAPTTNWGAIQA